MLQQLAMGPIISSTTFNLETAYGVTSDFLNVSKGARVDIDSTNHMHSIHPFVHAWARYRSSPAYSSPRSWL